MKPPKVTFENNHSWLVKSQNTSPLPPANVEQCIAFHRGINCKRHHTLFYNIGWGEGGFLFFLVGGSELGCYLYSPTIFCSWLSEEKKNFGQGFCSCVKKGPPGCNVFLLPSSLIILLIFLQAQGIGEVRVTIYDLLSYNVWHVNCLCLSVPGLSCRWESRREPEGGGGNMTPYLTQ